MDERVRTVSAARKLLSRPEFGALAGAVLIFMLFALAAGDSGMFSMEGVNNWGTVAAYLGILAVGAALLMIAGEFDLSVGSMVGFVGMMLAIPCLYWGWPVWLAVLFSFVVALSLGGLNGWLVVKTGLPSFIVTLAFFFILRGMALALSVLLTGKTIISSNGNLVLQDLMSNDVIFSTLFQGHAFKGVYNQLAAWGWMAARDDGAALAIGLPKAIIWWLLLTLIGAFTLAKTKLGNWIFAVGGDAVAAKNVGIPVAKV